LKHLSWIAIFGLVSGGPACAEVQWTAVDAEKSEIDYSLNDEWIDPFALEESELSPRDGSVHWERIPEISQNEQAIVWSDVTESEDNQRNIITRQIPKPPAPELESMNRSIAFSDGRVGPDIGFLVPPGFRWTPDYILDNSIRGWSRRAAGEEFLAWNNGDAVGQFYLQPFHGDRWSFGANLGIRSITNNPNNISQSETGEGVSAGLRVDYALSDTAGIALGAEQLVHFDDKTDTGRDIYLVASKGWWIGRKAGDFPLVTATAGIGSGYLGRNPNLQFGCTNIIDAGIAEVDNETFYPLCWGPIAAGAIVLSPKLSLFAEYNNFSFVTGASIAPFERVPLRATWGATLAQDFGGGPESYQFENDKTRWFFRVSLGL